MRSTAWLALLAAILLGGCTAARNAAVSTFRVLDTPHRLIREQIDTPESTTATTTRTETSDVVNPGRPVEPARVETRRKTAQTPRATPRPSPSTVDARPRSKPLATPRPQTTGTMQFPTAKPVPGRSGYVYSIDPKGGIVDVTGYKSGDKAKDPYTQQIFIVP